MRAEDIIKIINVIPDYILYIYPGYLTIYTYFFLRGKTLKDTKQVLLKAIMISYIYVSITGYIQKLNIFMETICYVILSVVIAYICFLVTKSEWILKFYRFLGINTTYYESDIGALAGIENKAWLIVYLKEERIAIEGSLGDKELEPDRERFITLEAYTKHKVADDGRLKSKKIVSYEGNYKEKCVIKYEQIKYIEKRDTT